MIRKERMKFINFTSTLLKTARSKNKLPYCDHLGQDPVLWCGRWAPTFLRNILPPSPRLKKTEAVYSSEIFLPAK
jgi:hypothetical protein